MTPTYSEQLQDKLSSLAASCGCYLFKDSAERVVYVGKAKNLRSRVRSYFAAAPTDDRYVIPVLRRVVADVQTVVTATEKEAAVLENELIKKYQPRFNVKLRDDKDFLCLRLDRQKSWPRLEPVRRPRADGARYFGPYHSATAARRTLRLVGKHFQLRTCSDAELNNRSRPCLQYQIKRCPAPCVLAVDRERYAAQVRAVELFLDGRHDELTAQLTDRMHLASEQLEYELAALYRDQLQAVQSIREAQRVVTVQKIDQDVIGLYRQAGMSELVLVNVRRGHVTDSRSFSLGRTELPDEEVLAGFLTQYYGQTGRVGEPPDELVLPLRPDAVGGLAAWLTERRGRRVKVVVPKTGPRAALIRLAAENAEHAFREKQRATDELEARLAELQKKLRLATLPVVIECCDISHLGGGDARGAIVGLRDGRPDKRRYRTFKVKTTSSGDDYAAMYEVLARRFRRGRDAKAAQTAAGAPVATDVAASATEPLPVADVAADAAWELPDLFVVDGGRGQLAVALAAARDLGLHELPIVALAKERQSVSGETLVDRVYLPGQKNGILLRPHTASLHFMAQVRDEAHRFANRGRERAGKARQLRSELDDIAGIGPVARKALLSSLGSVAAVRAATDEQILAVPKVTKRHLAALRKVFAPPSGVTH